MTKCESCGLVQKPGLRCERCNAVLPRPDLALASPAITNPGLQPEALARELPIDRRAANREGPPIPQPPPRRLPVPNQAAQLGSSPRPPSTGASAAPAAASSASIARPPSQPVAPAPLPRPPSKAVPPAPAPMAAAPAPVAREPEPMPVAAPPLPAPAPQPMAEAAPELATSPGEPLVVRASPASIFKRSGAWLIDAALISLVLFGYLKVAQALMHHPPMPTGTTGLDWVVNRVDAYQGIIKYGAVLGAVVAFVYSSLFHALGGRTPGERLFGIRLVDRTGRAPSLGRSVLRSLLALVSFGLLLLGFFMAFFDRRRQALHDKLTATFVVKPLPNP